MEGNSISFFAIKVNPTENATAQRIIEQAYLNRVDIDKRPKAANDRERVGDWEADTIIGKNHKGAIVTLDDRKSKLRLAFPLKGKKAQDVFDVTNILLEPIKDFVKTITYNNGKEFTMHEKTAQQLSCNTYFAKPYHSWERRQNEIANGLLRQYFPKSMELIGISVKQVFKAVDKLNSRPRKCLGFKTPYAVFEEQTGIDFKKLMGYGTYDLNSGKSIVPNLLKR